MKVILVNTVSLSAQHSHGKEIGKSKCLVAGMHDIKSIFVCCQEYRS